VEDGHLILAWANLGTLIEGTLKLYLSVWYRDYKKDAVIRKGKLIGPDDLQLEMLRQIFYKNRLWDNGWDAWAKKVQQRRNSIHAYKNRDIGTFQEYYSDLRRYLEFLWQIDAVLPYPDEYLRPYMLPYLI
jgi:hypothetical protein